jgi:hypothetical protein
MQSVSDFQFELKSCIQCKKEKIRCMNFPITGNYCSDCKKKNNRNRETKKGCDPKLHWKYTSFGASNHF